VDDEIEHLASNPSAKQHGAEIAEVKSNSCAVKNIN